MSETEKNVVTGDPETRTEKIERGDAIGERHKQEEPAGGRRGGNDVPWILVYTTTQRVNHVRTAPASVSEAQSSAGSAGGRHPGLCRGEVVVSARFPRKVPWQATQTQLRQEGDRGS